MSELLLTVAEVLSRPLFQKAQVIAGKAGLHRRVRWVHIVETPHIDNSIIQGEELILTMGVGLESDGRSAASFLEKLIKKNASCLFLELGHYFKRIPDEMIEIAERHQFPLIAFTELVNFIELTQDLHPLIINRHHQMLVKLDTLSREFYSLSLTSRGVSSILKLLHEETNSQIIYLPKQGTPLFVPRLGSRTEETAWLEPIIKQKDLWEEQRTSPPYQWKTANRTFLIQPVGALEQIWGYVAIAITNREVDEFDVLLLDRAAISITQDLMRKHFMEEKKSHSEAIWMEELIHNQFSSEEQIKPFILHKLKLSASFSYRIIVIELPEIQPDLHMIDEELESLHLHLSVKIRSAFKSRLFHPFLLPKSTEIVVLAVDLGPPRSGKERLTKVAETLQSAATQEQLGFSSFRIGIGREYSTLMQAHQSYHEAKQLLQINQKNPQANYLFYEDAGVYRLLLMLEKDPFIRTFIEDHLAPLIEHDRTKGTELLKTLQVFMEQDGSKQLTAQKLFIVRQTLYHRLEKIKELLGEDFMSADRRLALSMALRAYQFLHPESLERRETSP